jgi:cobalt-zinc-cadmium efflux system outer membrane protein
MQIVAWHRLLPCLLLLPWLCSAQTTSWFALKEHAMRHNQQILAIRQEIQEARGTLRQAGLRPPTQLGITGTTGRALGTIGEEQFGASISKTLEASGKRRGRIAVATEELALRQAAFDEAVRDLRYQLRLRYAEYAAETARLRIIDEVIQSWHNSLDLMTKRVEQGDAAVLERDLLRVELARSRAERARITGALEQARLDLAVLAAYEDPRQLPAAESPAALDLPSTLADMQRTALGMRPDLRAVVIAQRQAEAGVSLAKAEGKPDWTLNAGYSRVYSRFDDQRGVHPVNGSLMTLRDRDDLLSVGLEVPLFTSSRNQGNLESAVARQTRAQHRVKAMELSIPLQVEAAWNQYQSSREAYRILSEQVLTQSESNLNILQQAYQLGHLQMLDVLTEQRRLYSLRMEAVDLQLRTMQAYALLEYAYAGELQ